MNKNVDDYEKFKKRFFYKSTVNNTFTHDYDDRTIINAFITNTNMSIPFNVKKTIKRVRTCVYPVNFGKFKTTFNFVSVTYEANDQLYTDMFHKARKDVVYPFELRHLVTTDNADIIRENVRYKFILNIYNTYERMCMMRYDMPQSSILLLNELKRDMMNDYNNFYDEIRDNIDLFTTFNSM